MKRLTRLKFRFQVNGIVDTESPGHDVSSVSMSLQQFLERSTFRNVDITGLVVFKLSEKRVPTGRKRRPYVCIADRVTS